MEVMGSTNAAVVPAQQVQKSYGATPSQAGAGSAAAAQGNPRPQTVKGMEQQNANQADPSKKDLTKDEASQVADEMNEFMSNLNSDIRFKLDDKTKRLVLQVVNQSNGDVIKEIPSKEMLDLIVRLGDYVGALLDEKA